MSKISDTRGLDALRRLVDDGALRFYSPLASAGLDRGHSTVLTSWGPLMRR